MEFSSKEEIDKAREAVIELADRLERAMEAGIQKAKRPHQAANEFLEFLDDLEAAHG
jgi:hypothetical protein